ncbi:putative aldouronate transport system permease protein [Paenibacillus sp. V4I3]|uniref:ABC transporter permease n=1 Tax=unclassified Paenibacillus TaxID=185978 RepID=UPI002781FBB2|nr:MULTISPECIES: ABC transporter permease subunit [unclassified Paenibacillus]MDQ0878587.1 putative aldouronate transport system permease protein [Paenibacillus sp. V4I3]MDQ0885555.1 putative aldouronate transport system permease protein [Paenibacillus sp. V4I9]
MSVTLTELERKKAHAKPKTKGSGRWKLILTNFDLYLLLVPGLLVLFVFKYAPMYGIIIAFQDFNIFDGFARSKWVGLDQFEKLIHSEEFYQVFMNTLLISVYKIVLLFPIPIIIALFLNEVRKAFFKKTIQTIIFLPHFLSWVIISGLFINILSPSGGLVNNMIQWFGGTPISFFLDNQFFRSVVVFTAGWKESGWNAIIFIAAIAGIEQEQYEAASIDGAGRIRQMLHITLPGILPTIILILILRMGYLLEAGTEQILTMYNSVVYQSGDVIGTFVYRQGLGQQDYSFSTAVGLFNSLVGFILIVAGNELSKKLIKRSIW